MPVGTPTALAAPVSDETKAAALKKRQKEIEERDLKKMQGKWAIYGEQIGGVPFKHEASFLIQGNTIDGRPFTLDASSRPKTMTCHDRDEDGNKRTWVNIYAFDDDHLLLMALQLGEVGHPLDFGSRHHQFLRLERVADE